MSNMPRQARAKSSSKIYHCIIRGIDKRDIFLDDVDRNKFMKELSATKEKFKYKLHAYCLMDNHVHILIEEKESELAKIMHDLMLKYSVYFNLKYERVGHLFQNRFISKPVETELYLLTVQRYIHQNPPYMQTYRWSSYGQYAGSKKGIADTELILSRFGKNGNKAKEEFKKYTCDKSLKISVADYKDSELAGSVPDSKVVKIIGELLNLENIFEIKKYNTKIRNKFLKKIFEIDGITVGQLSRIMEIDKKTLYKIKNG